jgi:hypothetical protein
MRIGLHQRKINYVRHRYWPNSGQLLELAEHDLSEKRLMVHVIALMRAQRTPEIFMAAEINRAKMTAAREAKRLIWC